MVGTFGVAVTLAAFTRYNVTVKAAATVRPVGELRIVQAATVGTVKSIVVKENQLIEKGDAIAFIDNSQLQTKKSQLQGNIQNNQLQLSNITAQISALDTQRNSEYNLMNRTIAAAQADLSRNQRDYKEKQITTVASVQEAQAALELAREELKRYQQLANTGAIAQLQVTQKQQAFKAAQARLDQTLAALNPSAAPVAIAQSRIAQEKARGESTLATLNKERKTLLQRQIEIQSQIERDRRELQQTQTELEKSVVRSPASGTILQLNLRNGGQVLREAEPIAKIAPSNTSLVVKARVTAQDIGKVAVGQQVQMRVSAYPYPDYGTLKGKVSAIAADATTPQSNETTPSGAVTPFYEVTILPLKTGLSKGDRQYAIQPGMEIAADIISREETVLTFILRKARLITDL